MHERPDATGQIAVLVQRRQGHGPLQRSQGFYHPDAHPGTARGTAAPRIIHTSEPMQPGPQHQGFVMTEQNAAATKLPAAPVTFDVISPAEETATVFTPAYQEMIEIVDGRASKRRQGNRTRPGRQRSGLTRGDHLRRPGGEPPIKPPDNGRTLTTPEGPEGKTIAERHPDWNLDIQVVVGSHGNREEVLENIREYVDAADIVFYEAAVDDEAFLIKDQKILQNAAMPQVSTVKQYIAGLDTEALADIDMDGYLEPNIVKFFGSGAIVRQLDLRPGDAITAAEIQQHIESDYILPHAPLEENLTRLLETKIKETKMQNKRDDISVHEHLEEELASILAENPALQEVMKKRPLKVVIDRGSYHIFRINSALREEGFTPEIISRVKNDQRSYTDRVYIKLLLGKEPTKEDLVRAHGERLMRIFSYRYAFAKNLDPETLRLLAETIDQDRFDEIVQEIPYDSSWMKNTKYDRILTHIVSRLSLEDIRAIHDHSFGATDGPTIIEECLARNGITGLPINAAELDEMLYKIESQNEAATPA